MKTRRWLYNIQILSGYPENYELVANSAYASTSKQDAVAELQQIAYNFEDNGDFVDWLGEFAFIVFLKKDLPEDMTITEYTPRMIYRIESGWFWDLND